MVKVLHVIPSMARGGAEKFLSVLLPLLAARGFGIELVCLFDGLEMAGRVREAGIGVRVAGHDHVSPYRLSNILKGRRSLRDLIRLSRPDIVHTHLYLADMMADVSAPLGTRVVTTLHGSVPWWFWRRRGGGWVKSILMTAAESALGRMRGARYIAVSESVRLDAVRALGLSDGSVRLIHNAIDTTEFVPGPERSGGAPTIIQVGNFSPVKNHATSVRAMDALLKSVPGARLVLVGEGPLRSGIKAEVERRGITGAVEFLGSRNDVPELLRTADVYWMPSTTEGFSMACLEAMASGLPCVVSDIMGLGEAVVDGVTGYLVPVGDHEALADKTAALLRDQARARGMGMAGRKRVMEEFSPAVCADGYAKAYNDIMSGSW